MLSTFVLSLGANTPTFPIDFYSGEQSNLMINQGGYDINNGACCGPTSPQCKIQAQSMGADVREQGSMNRTRSDSARGTIVTWYGDVQKQMALVPGSMVNSTHKWACAQQCPTQGSTFMSSVALGNPKGCFREHAHDKGSVAITQPKSVGGETKTCEHYQWKDTLFCLLTMGQHDFYVDMSAKPPVPFFATQLIEPFGKKVGTENTSFLQFQPADLSKGGYFDIDPASIKSCKEPQGGCNQQSEAAQRGTGVAAHRFFFDRSILEAAEAVVAVEKPYAKPPPAPQMPNVSFGTDFTAQETSVMLINQGGAEKADGSVCCSSDAPQCQVQAGHRKGTRYLDVTNQRSRFDDALTKETIVALYGNIHKNMVINVTNGKETCQEYCPIDPRDTVEGLNPFDPFDKVTDKGQTTLEGQTVEHYQWVDKILKIIPMQKTDFYAKLSADKKTGVPVLSVMTIEPMGRPIGQENQTWSNWTPGVPDKSKFDIAGVDTCPQSKQCGQQKHQAARLGFRQFHTFYSHMLSTPEMLFPIGMRPHA